MGIGFKHGMGELYPDRVEVMKKAGTAAASGNVYTISCGFQPDLLAAKIGTATVNGKMVYTEICFPWEADGRSTTLMTGVRANGLELGFVGERSQSGAKVTVYWYDGSAFQTVTEGTQPMSWIAVKYTK